VEEAKTAALSRLTQKEEDREAEERRLKEEGEQKL